MYVGQHLHIGSSYRTLYSERTSSVGKFSEAMDARSNRDGHPDGDQSRMLIYIRCSHIRFSREGAQLTEVTGGW